MAKEIDNLDESQSQIKIGKDIEIEHSMIDFQALIVGEKVRDYQNGNFNNFDFNDKILASVLYVDNNEEMKYYNLETIRKIIDFQFVKTKKFL